MRSRRRRSSRRPGRPIGRKFTTGIHVVRHPPADVAAQLSQAYDAQLLGEVDERVVFRHQLVHDAIYQQVPAPVRRLLHREAAVALMAAGADPLAVADHLVLGAERGDEQAAGWLRDAAHNASGQAPSVTLELLRRAEALLPGGHSDADAVSAEVVQALLRAGGVAEASARAEAVLGRQHTPEVDTPLRVALVAALALQNRADEVVAVVEASLATPDILGPGREGGDARPAELGPHLQRRAGRRRVRRGSRTCHRRGDR